MAEVSTLEELMLPALADRLERALELVAGADVMDRLDEVAALCGEAQALAVAAALLRQEPPA